MNIMNFLEVWVRATELGSGKIFPKCVIPDIQSLIRMQWRIQEFEKGVASYRKTYVACAKF